MNNTASHTYRNYAKGISISDIVLPFCFGILFAPWNVSGFVVLLIYLVAVEAIICTACKQHTLEHYCRRLFIFLSGITGWILGRAAFTSVQTGDTLAEQSGLTHIMDSIS